MCRLFTCCFSHDVSCHPNNGLYHEASFQLPRSHNDTYVHCGQIWDSAYTRSVFGVKCTSVMLNSSTQLSLVMIFSTILQGDSFRLIRTNSILSPNNTVMEQYMFARQLQRCRIVPEETSYLKMLLYSVCPDAQMIFVYSSISNDGHGLG